jgi:hypothetical protein
MTSNSYTYETATDIKGTEIRGPDIATSCVRYYTVPCFQKQVFVKQKQPYVCKKDSQRFSLYDKHSRHRNTDMTDLLI